MLGVWIMDKPPDVPSSAMTKVDIFFPLRQERSV